MGSTTSTSTPFTAWTGTSREGNPRHPASARSGDPGGRGNRPTGPGHARCAPPRRRRTEEGGEAGFEGAGPPHAPSRWRGASDHGATVKQPAEQPDRRGGKTAVGGATRPLGGDPDTRPIIDARLVDGWCVAACVPTATPSTATAIRHFGGGTSIVEKLTASGSLPAPGGRGGGGRAPARAQGADLRRHRLRRDDAAQRAGVASPGGRDISIKDGRELQQHGASCPRFEARGLGRSVTAGDALPGTVVRRGVVGDLEAAIHRRISRTGGIRDCDAPETRWVVGPTGRRRPQGTNQRAAERSPWEHGRRQWR